MRIKQAGTIAEIEAARRLFREYEAFLGVDLCFQNFERELADLPGKYTPPDGALLIGLLEDKIVGCVALRKLSDGVCEMKRLFVRPGARGNSFGRQLAMEIIAQARELGYSVMRLDTLEQLSEAMGLYESLGFKRTDPYYRNPLPGVVYCELDLKKEPIGQVSDRATPPETNPGGASDTSHLSH